MPEAAAGTAPQKAPVWIYGMYAKDPPWGPPRGPCAQCKKRGWPGMNWVWTGREWKCETCRAARAQERDGRTNG